MIRFDRFDLEEMPASPKWYLIPAVWAGSMPDIIRHRTKIRKTGTRGLKPPYLVFGNHNSMLDFKMCSIATFPHRTNFIISMDGFVKNEDLLRQLGVVCKRKFTTDPALVPQLKRIVSYGNIPIIYPEAKLSVDGTTSAMPDNLGRFAKLLNVPIVLLICHGNHIADPCWRTGKPRGKVPTEVDMVMLYTKEQTEKLSEEEMNEGILKAFEYDDYKWQRENGIKITTPDRAEGLQKVLYQCPHCGKEYRMKTTGNRLYCDACGCSWTMDEYGALHSDTEPEKFSGIHDWYEWQRVNVREEIERGEYGTGEIPVKIRSLPSSRGVIDIGKGLMVHDKNGFRVWVTEPTKKLSERPTETREMNKPAASLYTCHVVYEKEGDCVDLNTPNDTWYVYPQAEDVSVTKMMLATEELHALLQK